MKIYREVALKPEQKIFIKQYLKSGDHIASYIKAVPGTDRKKAATCGKRWLKNQEIATEIAKNQPEPPPSTDEINNFQPIPIDDNTELEPRQRVFCEEYLKDLNATKAAERAGYSKHTANEQGNRLLAKVSIQDYIQQLQLARSRRTEITVDNVLYELACIAFTKVTDFVKVETKKRTHTILNFKPKGGKDAGADTNDLNHLFDINDDEVPYQAVGILNTDDLPDADRRAIASIKQGANGIELKMYDKPKALELIGRHLGMWNDKLQVDAEKELKELLKNVMGGAK